MVYAYSPCDVLPVLKHDMKDLGKVLTYIQLPYCHLCTYFVEYRMTAIHQSLLDLLSEKNMFLLFEIP